MSAKGKPYTEEQKMFINDMRLNNKTIVEIQHAFKEKWDRVPAPVTISKYATYDKWGRKELPDTDQTIPTPDVTPDEPPKDDGKEGGALKIEVKDTRKDKKPKDEIVHFSDGEMDDKAFAKIVALRGTSEEETFNFLKLCGQRGYTKINMRTGEILE